VTGDDDVVAVVPDDEARELVAGARPGHAVPGVRLEESAVRRADEDAPVLAEELVGPEVERCAHVRAAVDIRVIDTLVVDEEALQVTTAAHQT